MNAQLNQQLTDLQKKVKLLLEAFKQLQHHNLKLQKQLTEVQVINTAQQATINTLTHRNKALQLLQQSNNNSPNPELHKYIQQQINTVNQAIQLLLHTHAS